MNIIRSLLLPAIVLFTACHSNKDAVTDASDTGISEIIVSSGGGVTGKYETYILHNDGLVEKMDEAGKTSPYGKMDADLTLELFNKAEELKMSPEGSYEPGNMNYTISMISLQGSRKIQWSDTDHPKEDVLTFYRSLTQHIRDLK